MRLSSSPLSGARQEGGESLWSLNDCARARVCKAGCIYTAHSFCGFSEL